MVCRAPPPGPEPFFGEPFDHERAALLRRQLEEPGWTHRAGAGLLAGGALPVAFE